MFARCVTFEVAHHLLVQAFDEHSMDKQTRIKQAHNAAIELTTYKEIEALFRLQISAFNFQPMYHGLTNVLVWPCRCFLNISIVSNIIWI